MLQLSSQEQQEVTLQQCAEQWVRTPGGFRTRFTDVQLFMSSKCNNEIAHCLTLWLYLK